MRSSVVTNPRRWLAGAALALACLLFVLLFMEPTRWEIRVGGLSPDQALQDLFFDFGAHRWIVDDKAPVPRLLFYNGPKILLILLAVSFGGLALLFGRAESAVRRRFPRLPGRRDALFVTLAIILIPLVCNRGKAVTNIYCPYEHTRYGGHAPYVRLWDDYPPEFKARQEADPRERGRGFPAGHASGGFALMALAFALPARRRFAGLLAGCAAGWWMGGYQMLKGAHYLSHTLTTWSLAWLMLLALAFVVRPSAFRPTR